MLFRTALLSMLISGCTSTPYWERTWEGASSDPEIVVVGQSPWGPDVQGWTTCDKEKRACTIFIVANFDRECVERHERKHAAGWDHPAYRLNLSC